MPRAAGRVEKGDVLDVLPAHRRPIGVLHIILPTLREIRVGIHPHPGRAERVLDQELDHVRLGVELGRRDDVGTLDLRLLRPDLLEYPVFLLGVPVLVGPAEGIRRGEDLIRRRTVAVHRLRPGEEADAFLEGRH